MNRDRVLPGLLAVCALMGWSSSVPAQEGFRDCDACPEMVRLPAGSYVMGAGSDEPGVRAGPPESELTVITLPRPFAMSRHEVTRAEFSGFVRETGHEIAPGCQVWDESLARYADDGRRDWRTPGVPANALDEHPVTCIAWADAQAYVAWLARKTRQRYRLPSEAEWEYAARAGSVASRPWGPLAADGCGQANTYDLTSEARYALGWPAAGCRDGYADLAPVGQLGLNGFGLADMIGNVWEWTEDCATHSRVGRPTGPEAWTWLGGCEERAIRGGGWLSPPARSRSGHAASAPAGLRADYLGFRVARDIETGRSPR
jgi:formylglycine-generating enzyme required for sulfatase activity